ncbi:OprD family outer membrane porin [Sulfuricurvum sp.]|uniref:OprD family outer membrane porin n=1 Tax=Sulfuricurvum sp. TaxID=2025608 RepID=UPI002615194C|nr:OprD family outer membrane porin [Sulfuricurvum sp.]MDD3596004.1 OprD family outer membrane porin [Sulfuricurvum sp.]
MSKLSLTAALLLGSAVFAHAADDLLSAFKEGKLDGRLRAQYFYTDWDDDSKDSAKGFAVGGSLIYKTAPLYGFSFGTGLYTTQNPGDWTDPEDGATAATAKDLFSRDPGDAYGDGYAVLGQVYLQYDIAKSKIKGGRFLMTNPWINPNDTKMIPIAIEGGQFVSNDLPNTTIQIDYADQIKERGKSFFGNMADTGDTPTKISAYYKTHYGTVPGTHGDAPDVSIVGITNKSIDNLELQGWVMHWPDLVDQFMFEANYALEAGDVILTFGGRYLVQNDQGAGDIILPKTNNHDSDNSIDSNLWALRAIADYRAAKFLLSMSKTDSDGDILAPWRGFPTQGYTRSMTQTDWNANTKSYKAEFDYDYSAMVPGLSTLLSYAWYDRDPTKKPYQSMTDRGYQNGDTRQWNFDIIYKLSGSWKGTELKARLMDQNNEKTALYTAETSNREMRLEANYRF